MKILDIFKYLKYPGFILYVLDRVRIIRISDEKYLKILYKIKLEKKLNLEEPKSFNEKLQWLKLYDRKNEYTQLVDKYEVKKYVSQIIGDDYVIETIGVYDRFEDISFDELPNQFVIKCTHDSGGLIVCRDKTKLNIDIAKKKINKCLKTNYYYYGREWPYKDVKPRIIVEKYMQNEQEKELKDYKFYCFNSEPKYLYVSEGLENHETAKISFFDTDFNKSEFHRKDFKPFDYIPQKPKNFEKMKLLARKLANGHTFLRVDFYEINNKIYFGELTFTPCSGLMPFEPEKYDNILGDLIKLPNKD